MLIEDAAIAYRDAVLEKDEHDRRAWAQAVAESDRALTEVRGR